MTAHIAPRENQSKLPTGWAGRLLSRRGRRVGKAVVLDEAYAEKLRKKIHGRAAKLRTALARTENAEYADAGEAFLAGKADPRGAAAVAALMCDTGSRSGESWLRPELDAWAGEHGRAFAVAATVERLVIRRDFVGRQGGYENCVIVEADLDYDAPVHLEYEHGGIEAVRSLVADLTDAEYAEVVAAVAPHRTSPIHRVVAAILLPDERAWVEEACPDYARTRGYGWTDRIMLHSLETTGQIAAAGITELLGYHTDTGTLAAVLDNVGAPALPLLTDALASHVDTDLRKLLLKAVSAVPSEDAALYLLKRLNEPHVFEPATDAAARYPALAVRAALTAAHKVSPELRRRIAAIVGAVAPQVLDALTDDERAALDGLLAEDVRFPAAEPGELPALLTAPPWTRKRPKRTPVVIEGLEPPAGTRLMWAAGEHEEWSNLTGHYEYELGEDHWAELEARGSDFEVEDWNLSSFIAYGSMEKAEPRLDEWLATPYCGYSETLARVVARYGERVAGFAVAVAGAAKDQTFHHLPGPILSVPAARLAAERYARLKSLRASGAKWLDRHGLDAAVRLIPDALGADKKLRQYAEAALGHLSVRLGAEAVAGAGEPYGAEAVAAIAELLDVDPLEPLVPKLPKPGPWANPAMLPQVLLKGRERALPAESIPHLVTVLAVAGPEYPYPGLDVVAETCDRESLARFSRSLFLLWISVGGPSKDGWALTQLAHFAEDETVWTLAPLVREWPGQSQHKRAVTGLEVLGAIGTEEAMRAVQVIADRVKFKALKEEASRQIANIAASLGLSREQLADRLVPDFGLGEEAALVLDYGPRRFTVAFDEHLKPYVSDEDGKPRKALPKPGAKDDPDLATAAYQRFGALKKELRNVAADQVARMESAMMDARTWTAEEFRRFFVEHALTRHLARRLVWLAETGGGRFGFRIAEDGTLSDVEEDTVDLPDDAVIRVAHPVRLGDKVGAWAEILADYEILQPFDQLDRPVLAFTDEELATGRLARFEGAKVDVGRVLGMGKRGWRRAAPEDAGVEPGVHYRLPGGGYVTVALEPGIYAGAIGETPEQTVGGVRLCEHERYWWNPNVEHQDFPRDIDPVTAAEVLGALARLTGRA